ncbi:MAG: GAP family protein [Anaerocolumna aminovalerica]|uniref:GAP family protein n=2 Tax=Anaerocolumna aminovalerica TaxID=1527 RepID=UPI000BE3B8E1|nr:GAP family protein [Anaerocolumna aminovalerica]MDU6263566.1 GAP family protein [Anaerocolumna aminovalerica]
MLGLLITTILTSTADSLNPIAITQQFILQGMVKKPKHIWFFIIPTGVTNLIGGFLAYFGLIAFISDFFGKLMNKYGQMLYTFELILGIVFLIALFYLVHNAKIESLKKQISSLNSDDSKSNDETEAAGKIKSVSPTALLALGVCATISELTTALPYFAFLTILFNYQLTFIQVAFILIVYNTIYTLPLMILYFVYVKAQDKFDSLYTIIKSRITKWSNIIAPTAAGLIGSIMVYHSVSLLLK